MMVLMSPRFNARPKPESNYFNQLPTMKLSTKPLISVYMPVFNGNGYLSRAIESILNQTFSNFEFIIVDDGSTDNSWNTIKKYAKKDSRIVALKNNINKGVSYSANLAINQSRGQFVARMDADDISFPDRLAKQLEFLKSNKNVVACGTQCLVIDQLENVIGLKSFPTSRSTLREMIFYAIPMQQPSVMVNRKLLPKKFTWYFDKRPFGEDVGFIFRLLQHGEIANLDENLLCYRDTPNSLTKRKLRSTFNSTILSRAQAVKEGYRPSMLAIYYNFIQIIAVYLFPSKLIFTVWNILRGINKVDLNNYKVPSISC